MEQLVYIAFCIGLIWLCLNNKKMLQATLIFAGVVAAFILLIVIFDATLLVSSLFH
jgi:hypothetical protein